MQAPKITVLVPVYNGEQFLAECLDSILAQDFEDMEILIADDGSTDGSLGLIERYAAKDRRIRWWRNPRNFGLAGNFNACLQAAQGEYIKFVLQDDKLLSIQTVRLMAAVLDANPQVALVGSGSYLLDAYSRKTEQRKNFKSGRLAGRQTILRCLEGPGNLIGEPSVVMFRRMLAGHGFAERYPQGLDMELWFRLLETGDFFYLTEPLCAFRKQAAQQTEVNRRRLSNEKESFSLLEHCYTRPWFEPMVTRKLLFAQLYAARRDSDLRAGNRFIKMKHALGSGWYAVYWTRRKFAGPFRKLGLWFARQCHVRYKK